MINVNFCLNAQQIITFPTSESIPHNDDFKVKVRIAGGQWQDLHEYEALVDMHNVRKSSMVNFDFKGTVEFSITYNRGTVHSARIRPLSYGFQPLIEGNTLTFSLFKT